MASTLRRKRGDTKPFEAILTVNGAAVNLEGVTGVEFHMAPAVEGEGPTIVAPAEVVQTGTFPDLVDQGRVLYAPLPDDVAVPGTFRQEWEVFYADGSSETFPEQGYVDVVIARDIA